MIEKDRKINWLKNIISQREKAISEWQFVACRTNICDNLGVNPITKLHNEIKIANELIELCASI